MGWCSLILFVILSKLKLCFPVELWWNDGNKQRDLSTKKISFILASDTLLNTFLHIHIHTVDFVHHLHCQCIMKGSFNGRYEQEWSQQEKIISVFMWAPNYYFKPDLKNCESVLLALDLLVLYTWKSKICPEQTFTTRWSHFFNFFSEWKHKLYSFLKVFKSLKTIWQPVYLMYGKIVK